MQKYNWSYFYVSTKSRNARYSQYTMYNYKFNCAVKHNEVYNFTSMGYKLFVQAVQCVLMIIFSLCCFYTDRVIVGYVKKTQFWKFSSNCRAEEEIQIQGFLQPKMFFGHKTIQQHFQRTLRVDPAPVRKPTLSGAHQILSIYSLQIILLDITFFTGSIKFFDYAAIAPSVTAACVHALIHSQKCYLKMLSN